MNRRLLAVGAQKGGLEVVADDRPGCATEEWGGGSMLRNLHHDILQSMSGVGTCYDNAPM